MKRICLGFLAALALVIPVLTMPAWAETPSKTCVAAIKTANIRHKPGAVPNDCWRIGPFHLGMRLVSARTLLGTPGISQNSVLTYRRRKYPVTQLDYVFPRNLHNWLRLAPARVADFHPVSLRLTFSKDVLTAITVGSDSPITVPPCTASSPRRLYARTGQDFPYGFHGLTLGAPLSDVVARFGPFVGAKGSTSYGPLPLAVGGSGKVNMLDIASGPAFVKSGVAPVFQLQLDPLSCVVSGFTPAPGH